MTERLLLDEHYSAVIATELRQSGFDVVAVVAVPELRGASDPDVFAWAAREGRRIVTENIKDFRPLLRDAAEVGLPTAALLLVPPRRFPRGRGDRTAVIVAALTAWLGQRGDRRPTEDWLVA